MKYLLALLLFGCGTAVIEDTVVIDSKNLGIDDYCNYYIRNTPGVFRGGGIRVWAPCSLWNVGDTLR